ncbi:unnamed protein product [Chironomus riparius]|uniref:Uncharacterized protein n=1 Tax=Chironomus riparius TaxID=315576 RepID=A0A9N9WYE0_9DIPT|nr:unnamed protein product [Chironomus riparius]
MNEIREVVKTEKNHFIETEEEVEVVAMVFEGIEKAESGVKTPALLKPSVKTPELLQFIVKRSELPQFSLNTPELIQLSVKALELPQLNVNAPALIKPSVKMPDLMQLSVKTPKLQKINSQSSKESYFALPTTFHLNTSANTNYPQCKQLFQS